jgi:hypothetical protein
MPVPVREFFLASCRIRIKVSPTGFDLIITNRLRFRILVLLSFAASLFETPSTRPCIIVIPFTPTRPLHSAQEPVIQRLLFSLCRFPRLARLGCTHQRLGLSPFNALCEELLASRSCPRLDLGDARRQRRGRTLSQPDLFEAGDSIGNLPARGACYDERAPIALALARALTRTFELPEFRRRSLERPLRLLLFKLEHAQQPVHRLYCGAS